MSLTFQIIILKTFRFLEKCNFTLLVHSELEYPWSSPLPPALVTAAGLLVVGLLSLQYSARLHGMLACWIFAALAFALLNFSAARCLLDVSSQSIFDSEAEKGIRSSCPNCHLGCLVPPF